MEQLLKGYPKLVQRKWQSGRDLPESSERRFCNCRTSFPLVETQTSPNRVRPYSEAQRLGALIWNDRKLEATAFLKDYEKLMLDFGTDYQEVRNDKDISGIGTFFEPAKYLFKSFPNRQLFDLKGLKGRVLSSSYTPQPTSSKFEPMMKEIELIFSRNERDGLVSFDYDTKVFYGQI